MLQEFLHYTRENIEKRVGNVPSARLMLNGLVTALAGLRKNVGARESASPSGKKPSDMPPDLQREWLRAVGSVKLRHYSALLHINDLLESATFSRVAAAPRRGAGQEFLEYAGSGAAQGLYSDWLIRRPNAPGLLAPVEIDILPDAYRLQRTGIDEIFP